MRVLAECALEQPLLLGTDSAQCCKQLRQVTKKEEEKKQGQSESFRGWFTCGVCRQALLIASELECRVVYLCSGKEGCMAKCGCLLFMDIILASFSN